MLLAKQLLAAPLPATLLTLALVAPPFTSGADPHATGAPSGKAMTAPALEPAFVRLGAVGHREKRVVEFTLRNPDSTPLVLTEVKESCSCMEVRFDARTIPPGESRSGTVTITFGRSFGDFNKHVDFRVQGRRAPLVLNIFAKLHPGVRCCSLETVREGFVGEIQGDARQVIELSSAAVQLPPPEITELRWGKGGEHLRATLLPPVRNVARIEVTYSADHPEGPVRGELNALVNGRAFLMPVRGTVSRGIRLSPPHCNFNVVREASDHTERVDLLAAGGRSFEVLSTRFQPRARTIEVPLTIETSPREGGGQTLILRISPPSGLRGAFGGTVEVETAHPERPRIEVPVFGHLP
ncbi:MAG: DUF1573 domain-containing protein [Planctomycetota bacterium]